MKKLWLALIPCLAIAAQAQPATQSKDTPVLLVHGFMTYDSASINCGQLWGPILKELKAQGFTNVKTVTYYKASKNCDVNLAELYSNTGRDNTWKELGRTLSNYIFDHYTKYNQKVDLMGHSMGGLVIRSAVQGGSKYESGFRNILVEDAVTIATPHKGSDFANLCIHRQCKSLQVSHPDFKWLASNPNPQSLMKTNWHLQASNLDSLTTIDSGFAMNVDAQHKKLFKGLSHNAQLSNKASIYHAVQSLVKDK